MTEDQATQPSMYCRKCGYALVGLSENRCPECGQTFNPWDAGTYCASPRGHWLTLGWSGTPGQWHTLLTILVTLCIVDAAGYPLGLQSPSLVPLYAVALILLIRYMVGLAGQAAQRRRAQPPRMPPWPRRWLVLPLSLALVVASMAFSGQILRLRFAASRNAFERAARDALAGRTVRRHCLIGLYFVQNVWADGGTIRFVTGQTVSDPCGFEFDASASTSVVASEQVAPGWSVVEW